MIKPDKHPSRLTDQLARALSTKSLDEAPWGSIVSRVMAASLTAVNPATAIRDIMHREGNELIVGELRYDLARFKRIILVGAGKAGAPMASAVVPMVDDLNYSGLVIVKESHTTTAFTGEQIPKVEILEAGHPLPDKRGIKATKRLCGLLANATEQDLVICLLSGGGSALLASPVNGIRLDELQSINNTLLGCGADISEINSIRKHIETLKGGQLARLASPATLVSLILSDVIGDRLDAIASGPTTPDLTTYRQAYQVLEKYAVLGEVPESILEHLNAGLRNKLPETPKPGSAFFEKVTNLIIGSNILAARAALAQAKLEGLNQLLLTTFLQGEARYAGSALGAIARQIGSSGEPIGRPACLVAGGETTVTLQGNGLGGRNQEVALGAVNELHGLTDIVLTTLATDGGDGPSDAAGAVVTGKTWQRAADLGLYPDDFLQQNNAYHYFKPLEDLIHTGPTGTNVNDLTFIFAF